MISTPWWIPWLVFGLGVFTGFNLARGPREWVRVVRSLQQLWYRLRHRKAGR